MIKRNNKDILSISDNKRIRYPSRVYSGLFDFNGEAKGLGWGNQSKLKSKEAFSKDNVLGSLGSIGSTLGTFASSFKENASVKDMSGQMALIEDAGNTQFSEDDYDSLLNQWNNINWQSADYRAKDLKGVSTGQQIGNVFNSTASGAATGAQIGGPWGALAGSIAGLGTAIGGIFSGKKKAKVLADQLNSMSLLANTDNIADYNRAVIMANNNIYDNLYGNFKSKGGSIHIDPSKKGTFTAAATKHHKSVQEFARQVLSNKENYSSSMVRKANFARNASKWKAFGGNLNMDIPNYQTHGGDFFNGVTKINEGGTHEENPNGGIIMGVDDKGVPNLVEEGEVIYNDYVYSNRLTPDEEMLKKFNLPSKYKGKTYSYIAEDLSKESEETPLDSISKRGLQANMAKLATIQELHRDALGKSGDNRLVKGNQAAFGGRFYDGSSNVQGINTDALKSDGWRWRYGNSTKIGGINTDAFNTAQQQIDNFAYNYFGLPQLPAITPKEGNRVIQQNPVTIKPSTTNSSNINPSTKKPLSTNMRYAPIAISGMAALNSLLSKPDYENANIIRDAAKNIPHSVIPFNRIYNNYSYRPIDTDYILNQVKAQAGATDRAILNSNLNAGSAMAGLLSSGYNSQRAIGNALMQAENINNARRKEAAQMQTAVDQYNSQGLTNVAKANADLLFNRTNMRNTLLSNYASMREGIDNALEQSRSANLTNFADNLGNLGRENVNWNWLQGLKDADYFNVLNENMKYNKEGKRSAKYGGKIKRKK